MPFRIKVSAFQLNWFGYTMDHPLGFCVSKMYVIYFAYNSLN